MSDTKVNYLSRSALAESLGVTLKELTQALIEAGWLLHKEGKEWVLTAKGEFEGGEYRDSKKYGRYIVWPEAVINHPVIIELKQSHITATSIAKHVDLSAKTVNRLLAEMGWISPYAKGWQLTALGENYGGIQETHKDSGALYVIWPRALLEVPALQQRLDCLQGKKQALQSLTQPSTQSSTTYITLDGVYVDSMMALAVAHYLYLSGVVYAFQSERCLSKEDSVISDFYLLKESIHIFYEPSDVSPDAISDQLARQEVAKNYQLKVITLTDDDIDNLESVLSKAFTALGVALSEV